MIAMLDGGLDINSIITHEIPVDDFQTGFDTMLSGQSGKVVLDWGQVDCCALLARTTACQYFEKLEDKKTPSFDTGRFHLIIA